MRIQTTLSAIVLTTLVITGGCAATQEPLMPASTETKPAEPASSAAAASAKKTGHVAVNGLRYYYEIHGQGEPLLLLHGGLGSIDMFGPLLPAFAKTREVIAVDLHGHGRTQLGDRKIWLPDIGDDLAGILDQLGYAKVDVLGYSFGAGAGFRLAVQHPDKVRRLVIASAGVTQDSFYPEMLPMQAQVGAGMAEMMKETPMYKSYAAIAPDPSEFPRLLDAMGELMRTPFDWREDAKKLAMPTMLVYGDSDMIRLDKVVELYNLLGGGLRDAGWQREHMSKNRLAILPNLTHYEVFMAPELVTTVLPFLDGKDSGPVWAAQVDAK